jgi:hypothetical protein
MRKRITAISAATVLLCNGPAYPELSANIGWASDHFYRGISANFANSDLAGQSAESLVFTIGEFFEIN